MTSLKAQLPIKPKFSQVSEKTGKVFNDMTKDISKKNLRTFDSTTIGSDGEKVYMYTKGDSIMQAAHSRGGVIIEVRFPTANAVDRVSGWNKHAKRKFMVVYDNSKPYAVIGSGNNVDSISHVELDKDAWYTVDELVSRCKM